MANCKNCNTQMDDNANVCPSCNAAVNTSVSANDAEDNKLMAILAYIIFWVPLVTGDYKKSPFVKFHLNQAFVLLIVTVAYSVVFSILSVIFAFLGAIGGILIMLLGLIYLAISVLYILGIVNAATGKTKALPIIGDKLTILK